MLSLLLLGNDRDDDVPAGFGIARLELRVALMNALLDITHPRGRERGFHCGEALLPDVEAGGPRPAIRLALGARAKQIVKLIKRRFGLGNLAIDRLERIERGPRFGSR